MGYLRQISNFAHFYFFDFGCIFVISGYFKFRNRFGTVFQNLQYPNISIYKYQCDQNLKNIYKYNLGKMYSHNNFQNSLYKNMTSTSINPFRGKAFILLKSSNNLLTPQFINKFIGKQSKALLHVYYEIQITLKNYWCQLYICALKLTVCRLQTAPLKGLN